MTTTTPTTTPTTTTEKRKKIGKNINKTFKINFISIAAANKKCQTQQKNLIKPRPSVYYWKLKGFLKAF